MIPADHITFNDDGTAWLVVPDSDLDADWDAARFRALTKPCDVCGGTNGTGYRNIDPGPLRKCPHCIDGEHTFDIEVESEMHRAWERSGNWYVHDCAKHCTLRVSVVPGTVLPILQIPVDPKLLGRESFVFMLGGELHWQHANGGSARIGRMDAARPGLRAVKLKVAS